MAIGQLTISNLHKHYNTFRAVEDVNLSVPPGSFLSLLGPSGCGKTTTLRMIAGFIHPTIGEIEVDGEVVSSADFVLPAEKRQMGMVFQSYAVWPHMSVFENVAYGLRTRRTADAELKRRVNEAIEIVGLKGQEQKFSSQLSGGQQQRVALARAVVTEPRILLLDEPLSNLDAKLRESMRIELKRLQRKLGITAIFVTHNQEEALLLSDQIAVMSQGRVIELCGPHDLYEKPRTRMVAEFVGLSNIIPGSVTAIRGNFATLETPIGKIESLAPHLASDEKPDGRFALLVRPESIELWQDPGEGRHRGRIVEALYNGNIIDYLVKLEAGDLSLRIQQFAPQRHADGDTIFVGIPKNGITVVEDYATKI
ncbi:ABC transporter ATP-binding protein [Mesorhizobium sp. SB112]|uniref:ABC transporter ATP-binding protein n=1 Tax=Mesorhizobium sp. SB112 TaxID=3151853 RepID=UPI003267A696